MNAARVGVTSVPAYGVAPNRRPSMGVGQSQPPAAAFAPGWAAAYRGLCPAAAPDAGCPGGCSGCGAPYPPASSGPLTRQDKLPTRGLSARGRTGAADRHPGRWVPKRPAQ